MPPRPSTPANAPLSADRALRHAVAQRVGRSTGSTLLGDDRPRVDGHLVGIGPRRARHGGPVAPGRGCRAAPARPCWAGHVSTPGGRRPAGVLPSRRRRLSTTTPMPNASTTSARTRKIHCHCIDEADDATSGPSGRTRRRPGRAWIRDGRGAADALGDHLRRAARLHVTPRGSRRPPSCASGG
jgi:hypothetical protein